MVMENKPGNCPRLGADIYFEVQYDDEDGQIIYHDCSCSELIACSEYDEGKCPWIWYEFFCHLFGIEPETPESVAAAQMETADAASPTEEAPAEEPPAEEPPAE